MEIKVDEDVYFAVEGGVEMGESVEAYDHEGDVTTQETVMDEDELEEGEIVEPELNASFSAYRQGVDSDEEDELHEPLIQTKLDDSDSDDGYLEKEYGVSNINPYSADATPRAYHQPRVRKSTPFVRKIDLIPDDEEETGDKENELQAKMDSLRIADTPGILRRGLSTKKKTLGVRFKDDEGSQVTVLTPVRLKSKKEKEGMYYLDSLIQLNI